MNKRALISGIIIVLILTAVGFVSVKNITPPSKKNTTPQGMKEWQQTLVSLNATIANSLIDAVLSNDPFATAEVVSGIKNNIKGLEYIIIVDKNGKILYHPDSNQVLQDYTPQELKPLGEKGFLIQKTKKGKKNIYDVGNPIAVADKKIGEVHLGIVDPWIQQTKPKQSNLPNIILIVGAVLGVIIAIIGSTGKTAADDITYTPPKISPVEVEKLKKDKKQLETSISQLQKELKDLSNKKKQYTPEDEKGINKRVAILKEEERKLVQSIDEKKAEITKLENKKEALSTTVQASPEINKLKDQLIQKDKQISELTNKINQLKTATGTQKIPATEGGGKDIEELKKEELELTQRIVKKRREEIILSQRVETKRKEELALERKIEALQKKIKEMGTDST